MILRVLTPILVLLSGCSSGGGGTEADIRGIWEIKVTFEGDQQKRKSLRVTMSFDQDDDFVFGTFAGADGSGGKFDGQISDRDLDLVLVQTTPCKGNLELLATLADEENDRDFTKFAGTLIGDACDGKLNGAVTAKRKTD